MERKNVIAEKSFNFSLDVINVYKLMLSVNEYVLSKQLIRSATSIGANVEEAGAAISKKDFINKMTIASKEARETKYWLRLLQASQLVKYDFKNLIADAEEIIKIITVIIKTAQKNSK